MTPKEKAKELVDKFTKSQYYGCIICDEDWDDKKETAKQCALIAVNEIINVCIDNFSFYEIYWIDVKTEIEAL